jgi:hypothetical protein
VLPTPLLDGLAEDGKVRADSHATFGTVGISVVVKEGAQHHRRPTCHGACRAKLH